MSNVDNVTTTTTNKIVDSANSAVSIGRWSNLAIIACSPSSIWGGDQHYCSASSFACGCAYRLWGNPLLLWGNPLLLPAFRTSTLLAATNHSEQTVFLGWALRIRLSERVVVDPCRVRSCSTHLRSSRWCPARPRPRRGWRHFRLRWSPLEAPP